MLSHNKLLSIISNRFLELIILPTEQCNFRCVYCYEDFMLGKMKRNTIDAIKTLLSLRASSLDMIKLSWFGGEPLAAKDIIYEICEHALNLCQENKNLYFSSEMTTNGYLLKLDILTKLISLGVKTYQISLDGTEQEHNKTRLRLDGKGTFEKIWENLLSAHDTKHDFKIILRLHVTPENIDNMILLVNQIKETFGYDQRFSVFFKAIENLGGPNKNTFKTIHNKDKQEIIAMLYKHLGEKISAKRLDDHGPHVCYAAQTNSFLIRADGKIGKCTVAFSDDRNIIGQINDDGTLSLSKEKIALWTRGIKNQNLNELSCPMYNMPKNSDSLKSIPIRVE